MEMLVPGQGVELGASAVAREHTVHGNEEGYQECPYRRPWNHDKTWTSAIEANQYRPCTDVWLSGGYDQGGFGADMVLCQGQIQGQGQG